MKERTGSLFTGEFIGMDAEVVEARHGGYTSISGRVVDETKKTLTIEDDGEKIVPKKDCQFLFKNRHTEEIIEGSRIEIRPEDRIKRLG